LALVLPTQAEPTEEARELYREATRELSFFNFQIALGLYEDAAEHLQAGDGELWLQVQLGKALAAQSNTPATREMLAEAEAAYRRVIDAAPGSAYAGRATLNLGRIAEIRDFGGDEIDLDTARQRYREVLEGWPGTRLADEAALRYADTYFQRFDDPTAVAEGAEFLETYARDRATSHLLPVIWEVLATVKQDKLNDRAGALEAFLKAEELGLAEPNAAGMIYYRAAKLAEEQPEKLDTAIRLYQKVITDAPRSGRAFNAQLALQRLQKDHPGRVIEIPAIEMFSVGSEAD
jgi:outer membrane protein assembly factor BamD (BamD/ComL family)